MSIRVASISPTASLTMSTHLSFLLNFSRPSMQKELVWTHANERLRQKKHRVVIGGGWVVDVDLPRTLETHNSAILDTQRADALAQWYVFLVNDSRVPYWVQRMLFMWQRSNSLRAMKTKPAAKQRMQEDICQQEKTMLANTTEARNKKQLKATAVYTRKCCERWAPFQEECLIRLEHSITKGRLRRQP